MFYLCRNFQFSHVYLNFKLLRSCHGTAFVVKGENVNDNSYDRYILSIIEILFVFVCFCMSKLLHHGLYNYDS